MVRKLAIQISENHLSPEAVKALNNAKNKSQFLRDAIEFYVNRKEDDNGLKNDIKQIKELLVNIHTVGITSTVINEVCTAADVRQTINKSVPKNDLLNDHIDNDIIEENIIDNSNDYSEEDKRAIEANLFDNINRYIKI